MHPPSNAPGPRGRSSHCRRLAASARRPTPWPSAQAQFAATWPPCPWAWQFSARLTRWRVRAFHLLRTAPDLHLLLRVAAMRLRQEPLRRFVFRSRLRIAAEVPTSSSLAAVAGWRAALSERRLPAPAAGSGPPRGAAAGVALPLPEAALAEVRRFGSACPRPRSGSCCPPGWISSARAPSAFRKGCYPAGSRGTHAFPGANCATCSGCGCAVRSRTRQAR